jgi:hypothetical protein
MKTTMKTEPGSTRLGLADVDGQQSAGGRPAGAEPLAPPPAHLPASQNNQSRGSPSVKLAGWWCAAMAAAAAAAGTHLLQATCSAQTRHPCSNNDGIIVLRLGPCYLNDTAQQGQAAVAELDLSAGHADRAGILLLQPAALLDLCAVRACGCQHATPWDACTCLSK